MSESPGREAWRTMLGLFFSGQAHGRMQEASAAVGLAPGVMKTLLQLEAGDGVAMRDLADQWRCDASYVTSLADALEERGLAERRPHPTDRRIKMLVVTPEGLAARDRALRVLHEPPPSFDALTATEQRQLRDLLRKIMDAAQATAGAERVRAAAVR